MARFWVLGSPVWDRVIRVDAHPARGGFARGRDLGGRPGGSAANVARGLSSLGHEVFLVGSVGDDDPGRALLDDLERWGVATEYVRVRAGRSAESLALVDPDGESGVIALEDPREPAELPLDAVSPGDAVFVGVFPDGIEETIARIRERASLVAAPVPPPWVPRLPADIFFASAAILPPAWRSSPFPAARALGGDAVRWLVVTRGAEGAAAYSDAGIVEVRAEPVEPVDCTGAGDALAAGVVHGLVRGLEIRRSLEIGVRWAAEAVRRAQSTPPPGPELGLDASEGEVGRPGS